MVLFYGLHFSMLFYLLLSFLRNLITITLNCISDRLLAFISFNYFSADFFCPFNWNFIFVLFIVLYYCTYFSVLKSSTMTPSICGVPLCSRYFVGPNGVVSLLSLAGWSRNISCVGFLVYKTKGFENTSWGNCESTFIIVGDSKRKSND